MLLLQLGFSLHILLLVFGDEVTLELDFFKRVQVFRVGEGGLLTVLLLVFLEVDDLFLQILQRCVCLGDLGLLALDLILLLNKPLVMHLVLSFHSDDFLLQNAAIPL